MQTQLHASNILPRLPLPQVIARLGRWLHTALTSSYLRFFKPEGLLAAGGWDRRDYASFFSPRFHVDVPDQLVAEIMPFLASLQQQVRGSCMGAWARAAPPTQASSQPPCFKLTRPLLVPPP
jgi:hypothetical protein